MLKTSFTYNNICAFCFNKYIITDDYCFCVFKYSYSALMYKMYPSID